LADACVEMEKYLYPFVKAEILNSEDKAQKGHLYYLKEIQKVLQDWNQKRDIYWQLLDELINKLIGSSDNSENGCIEEVVLKLSR